MDDAQRQLVREFIETARNTTARKWNFSELARRAEVDLSQLHKFLRGDRSLGQDKIEKVLHAFGTNLTEVLAQESAKPRYVSAFCPNGTCRGVRLSARNRRIEVFPTFFEINPSERRTCIYCGSVLECRCTNCNERVSGNQAFCSNCGDTLATPPMDLLDLSADDLENECRKRNWYNLVFTTAPILRIGETLSSPVQTEERNVEDGTAK